MYPVAAAVSDATITRWISGARTLSHEVGRAVVTPVTVHWGHPAVGSASASRPSGLSALSSPPFVLSLLGGSALLAAAATAGE